MIRTIDGLEKYPELDKWLDDVAFDSDDLDWQESVVLAEEVQDKLIELGSRIQELESGLERLIHLASECDSWESFPQQPLDAAYELITQKVTGIT